MRHSAGWRSSALACRPPLRSSPRSPPGKLGPTGAPAPSTGTTKPMVADATTPITFRGPGGRKLMGAWAHAAKPRGGVLVVHENRGLTDHIRSVASRFAASGYSALAIDLLSEEGGTAIVPRRGGGDGCARTAPHLSLRRRHEGGSHRAQAAPCPRRRSARPAFASAAGWSGRCSPRRSPGLPRRRRSMGRSRRADFAEGLEGGRARHLRRARLARERDASRRRGCCARAAGVPHQLVAFPGADHAFFNDTGPRYNRTAAEAAYKRVLAWFARYVR